MEPEKLITEIGLAERHFNDIEARYRLLTSTWVLAAFTAMGFALKTDGLPFSKEVIIFAIGVASSAGVQLLWVIDLFVYHRLLDANFVEGFRMELNDPTLPRVHRNMHEQFNNKKGVTNNVRFFYFGCSIIPFVFSVVTFSLYAIKTHNNVILQIVLPVILLISLMISSITLFAKSNNKWLLNTIEEIKSEYNSKESTDKSCSNSIDK